MNIKLTELITDLDGSPAGDGLTLGAAIEQALLIPAKGDDQLTGAAKVKLFMLASRLHGKESADLTAEDVVLVKERVGRLFTPIVVGRVWAAIDPASMA